MNIFSDNKSIDAAKQLRYAEHYYKYSHKKLGRMSENCSNGYNMKKHKKRPTYKKKDLLQSCKSLLQLLDIP